MGRTIGKLTALAVSRLKDAGYHSDGGGLLLQVTAAGAKTWVFRYQRLGKRHEMGLGALHAVPLARARDKAAELRGLLADGRDPLTERRADRAKALLEAASALSFMDCADSYIKAHEAGWRSDKHAKQWRSTLDTYVKPVFGDVPVQAVDVSHVMRVLDPIWAEKTETASRVRGRVESVLDWATARGHRKGENPARWKGHLENLLPKRTKVAKVEHHAALPYDQIAGFMEALEAQGGIAAQCLAFVVLTAARTSEAIGARWSEIDMTEKVWTVPASRIKGGKEHRVPLSPRAVSILEAMNKLRPDPAKDGFVFPGLKAGKPLSNMAMLALLKRMGRADLTAHGFRSSFRDWAAEQTNFSREVAEMALAHTVSDKVEAAYRRGDLFQKRRLLMDAWANYCSTPRKAGEVVAINRRVAG
jgi:integrase